MIIDSHVHVYPDRIADKAAQSIGRFYGIEMTSGGSLQTLLDIDSRVGIDMSLIHSVATVTEQVTHINDFIARTVQDNPDRFIGFGTLHPGFGNLKKEIDRILSLGLRGVKLHPDFQRFSLIGPQAYRIFAACEGRLPVLLHTGDPRYDYSHPEYLAAVARDFPDLQLIGAHFGAWNEWERVEDALAERPKNLWVDCSSSSYALSPERFRELIAFFGEDRIFFGSDYPMWAPDKELVWFRALGLPPETEKKILGENLIRFLGMLSI